MNDIIKKYPELDSIAMGIANHTCIEINKLTRDVKAETYHKAQYTLEEVIEVLQSRV